MDGNLSDMTCPTLRNRVRELRKSAGMTIDDLAAVSGVGTTAIKAVEGGHAPTPTVQARLSVALNARVEDVFFWTEPSEPVEAAAR
jgi:DNA-binding XRE family transcriptional regulator